MNMIGPQSKFAILAVLFCTVAATPALAMDPVCVQMRSASSALRTKPFHMYMTATESFSRPNMAKAASSIGMGGTKQSEEISTGKSIYVMTRGKWIDMQTSFADMENEKDGDPDTKKALESSKCKALPDEAVFGQSASVYFESTPGLGIETKLWVSKSTHLPLKTDITNDQGTMKTVSSSRYEYSNVQAPSGAISMKDMVKQH
jgi:hypothetical protein